MKKTSENGQLFFCGSCKKIHLEFGTIGFDFQSKEKLAELYKYLKTVNSNHLKLFESTTSQYRRTILIPFPNISVKMLLSDSELIELIQLIGSFLDKQQQETEMQPIFENLKTVSDLNGIILN